MALSVNNILADASARMWDPLQVRYKTSEMIVWMNWAAKELSHELGFQKKKVSVLGSTYIASKGTTPKYYELPSDFVMLDRNEGIKTNGLRRLPTTGGEVDLFSEKEIASTRSGTITVDDYFTESFTGLIFHYSVEFVDEDEVAASRSGRVFWLTPNPEDTDTVEYVYIMLPTAYTVGGAMTSRLIGATEECLVYGIMSRAAEKALFARLIPQSTYDTFVLNYERKMNKAKKYYEDFNKQKDKQLKILTHRQVYDLYNSAGSRRSMKIFSDE